MSSDRDQSQIVRLVDENYRLIYRFALRLCGSETEAEDLAQQTFLSAHRHWDQLRQPEKARSWLLSITRNAYLKRSRQPRQIHFSSMESPPEPVEISEGTAVDEERLRRALEELSEEYRTPLILYYFEEFSYRDIAELLSIPIGTVMSRLSRAKQHLRCRLGQSAEEPPAPHELKSQSNGPVGDHRLGKGTPRTETL
jgi:RNA polymerase sigma-70 factor (ECF subfamily)